MSVSNTNSTNLVNATPLRTTKDIISTNSNSTADEECKNELPDYETLRNQNLDKINSYYNKILGDYTTNYTSYLNKINSADNDDRQNALTQIKPKVKSYNDHLIKINQEMIAKVNLTNDLIVKQKEELDLKRKIVNENYIKIDNLKLKNRQLKNDNQGKESNLTDSNQLIKSNNTYKYGIIGVNILVLVVIIALLFYLYMK